MTVHLSRIRFRAYQIDESFDFDDTPPPPPEGEVIFSDPFGFGATITPPWEISSTAVEGTNVTHRVQGDLETLREYNLDGLYTQLVAETQYSLSVDITLPQSTFDYMSGLSNYNWPGDPLVLYDNLSDQDGCIGFDIFDEGHGAPTLADWWNGDALVVVMAPDVTYHVECIFTIHSDFTADAEFFVDSVSVLTENAGSGYDFSGRLTEMPTAIESFNSAFADTNYVMRIDNVLLQSL